MKKEQVQILIVDDEKEILESLKTHLSLDGYRVDICNESKKAIQIFESKTFHIVLTDINMPHMDGLELLEKIKALRGDTLVIVITAYSTLTKVLNCRYYGAFDYVLKPFRDLDEFDTVIDRAFAMLNRWDQIVVETRQLKSQSEKGVK